MASKTHCFRLKDETARAIAQEAMRTGKSKTAIVAAILDAAFKIEPTPTQNPVTDRLDALEKRIEQLERSGDLLANPHVSE